MQRSSKVKVTMKNPVDILIRNLQEDRKKILQGDIAGILEVASCREEQCKNVTNLRNSGLKQLQHLKEVASLNAQLLHSAISGVKDARAKFGFGSDRHAPLSTYNKIGNAKTQIYRNSPDIHRI